MPVAIPRGVRLVLATAAAFVACGATATAAFANYTANITAGTVAPGTPTTFTLALTDTSRTVPLNAAIVTPPQGFTLTAASVTSANGKATVLNGKVVAHGLALAQNQTATIAITATTPSTCGQSSWTPPLLEAFKSSSFDGPALTLDSQGSSLTLTTCSQTVPSCPTTCTTTVGSPPGSLTPSTATATAMLTGNESGALTESVDVGNKPKCNFPGPNGAPYVGVDHNFYTVLYTPNPGTDNPPGSGQPAKTITYTIFNTNSDQTINLCFEAPYEFEQIDDTNAPPATDGNGGFAGLLESCTGPSEVGENPPDTCQTETQVADDSQQSGNDTVFTINIQAGEPGDPAVWG
jgi:hypothetical protein